ncbi:MAG: DUF1893 domain-containing protein [Duncaniella sp.]|nr:DUF1893 domain-containing protein [Duncaniella sp.]
MLHSLGCSCIIDNGIGRTICRERGVKDLLRILTETPALLAGSFIADKVVGKGAAAIMTAGGVAAVYADTISRPALEMFSVYGITVTYSTCVPNIINRTGIDICPVERLCADISTPAECIPLIQSFVNSFTQQ